MSLRTVLATALLLAGAAPRPALAAADGAAIFTRCAACHTRTGAGVPGTYPPLQADYRRLATSPAGRRYLVLTVVRGQMGPLTVEGKSYAGIMPAQAGLDDEAIAAVLNHVGTTIAQSGPVFRPFTAAEVGKLKTGAQGLSPADVNKLHQAAGGK